VLPAGRRSAAQRKRLAAERALHQALKMETIGQLTGGVAHDFNNLMPPESVKLRQMAEKAMNGANLAGAVTQRFLAFSRSQPLEPRAVNVNALITGMSDLFHRTWGETIAIDTKLAAAVWMVRTDPSQLENTLLNLAINARDAMPEGGTLTIEAILYDEGCGQGNRPGPEPGVRLRQAVRR
jgi:signal transduction histidine kinase